MDHPVAIITGAGRGVGRATAVELARLGYRLALASRNSQELNETIRGIGDSATAASGRAGEPAAVAVPTDVTRADEVDALVRTTIERFGRVDAVVHCAGLAPVRAVAETSDEEWHAVLDTNLSAAFYLLRAAWPTFARQKQGVAVNVSSLAARDPFPGFAAYGAAKAGLHTLGLSAAREGQPLGIRVHTIAPGAIETAMFRQILSPDQWPPDKTLSPADVAALIGRCVTGELRHTSGEVIYVHKTV